MPQNKKCIYIDMFSFFT